MVITTAVLTGCATGPRIASYSFKFHAKYDGWADNAEVLAYKYGEFPGTSNANEKTYPSGGAGTNLYEVGDFLYVKWKVLATGEVVEDTVDLRNRLPKDMTDVYLSFTIHDKQLYVYVRVPLRITMNKGSPANNYKDWPSVAMSEKIEIYPELTQTEFPVIKWPKDYPIKGYPF